MSEGFLPPAARRARTAEKRHAILRFLRSELYTTREVVQELLGVAPTPAKMTLAAMARDGLLRMESVVCPNGWRPTLWGITAHGQAQAFEVGIEAPEERTFEPGRVGLTVLRHTITLQLLRMRAERAGWTDWQAGDRLGKWEAGQGRPDALARDPAGRAWGIELELTMKTTKRYESVLFDRLRQIKAGTFARAVWVAPDRDQARRLAAILLAIREFDREVNGTIQRIQIDPATHHPALEFVALDGWPALTR